jgi:hypothetical protein
MHTRIFNNRECIKIFERCDPTDEEKKKVTVSVLLDQYLISTHESYKYMVLKNIIKYLFILKVMLISLIAFNTYYHYKNFVVSVFRKDLFLDYLSEFWMLRNIVLICKIIPNELIGVCRVVSLNAVFWQNQLQ